MTPACLSSSYLDYRQSATRPALGSSCLATPSCSVTDCDHTAKELSLPPSQDCDHTVREASCLGRQTTLLIVAVEPRQLHAQLMLLQILAAHPLIWPASPTIRLIKPSWSWMQFTHLVRLLIAVQPEMACHTPARPASSHWCVSVRSESLVWSRRFSEDHGSGQSATRTPESHKRMRIHSFGHFSRCKRSFRPLTLAYSSSPLVNEERQAGNARPPPPSSFQGEWETSEKQREQDDHQVAYLWYGKS